MGIARDLTGAKLGRLTVIERVENGRFGHTRWLCQCSCGNKIVVFGRHLTNGQISCGCFRKELRTTHGHTAGHKKSKEWILWCSMIQRCNNPNKIHYKYYGGRGIKVCDRWLNSFENFFNDIGPRPNKNMVLDRHPNMNGNYEPGNIRWATRIESARNKRNSHLVTAFGETKSIVEWLEDVRCAVRDATLRYRIKKEWNPEIAISKPIRKKNEQPSRTKYYS